MVLASCGGNWQKAQFFAQGNCEACKALIEASLDDQPGIDSVGWDFASSLITVKYDPAKTTPDHLQQAIAKKGFETQFYPADAAAQKALPACCQEAINRKLKSNQSPH